MAHPSAPSTPLITVHYRRRLLVWVVAVCWPLALAMCTLGTYVLTVLDIESQLLFFVMYFPPMWCAMMGTLYLAQTNCLTYDVHRRRVWSGTGHVQRTMGRWKDGDRLNYSIYLGRLERIRPSGKRRAIVRNAYVVDQSSWTAFVDVFLTHQNETRRGEDADAADQGLPTAVEVGIRWRFFTCVLLVGLALGAWGFWLVPTVDGPLPVVSAAYFLFGAVPLVLRPVLRYEDGLVSVKTVGRVREFPSRGYERLEYSVYWGCLFEVRADGKRRRVARGWARDQDSWKVFVDRFMEDRSSE
ncbi:hypothetical protein [Glycomyces artemisiae]|uniref:Uncharacterized protein n=1 Tax=Glycomyces artemisiae TaxID=1076443 RepID=A0A2T0UTB9_9ACTN|nr:hypothetical protein [Glycomyces artemisiae]PRY61179.1 hypothetical protein B0I28_102799 [Glycomyces artemisiae]